MEMHQVRYFLAAVRERNFTKAAAQCSVSPPSLLRAIRLLEQDFGGPLFNRERGNVHLTELGRVAFPHLEQLFKESLEAKKKAKDFLNSKLANLKLGIMCTIGPEQFVGLVREFSKQYPNIALQILDDTAFRLHSALLAGELDIAIYALPIEPQHPRLNNQPLFREDMVIAIGAEHSLAGRKHVIARDLHGERYLDRLNCEFTGYAEKFFAERSVVDQTVYQSDRDDWILAMAAAGFGYALMPSSMAHYPGVIAKPLRDPELHRVVNLATVRGRPHAPAVGAMVRTVMRRKWLGQKAISVRNTSVAVDE